MIKSFADTDTERVYRRQPSRRLPPQIWRSALRKLLLLNVVRSLHDLRSPGNQLEKLEHERAGQWSIRINDQWRICFEWRDGHAYGVEITDYH